MLTELKEIEAKPFEDMILLDNLFDSNQKPTNYLNQVMQRMSAEDERKAILTGEFQFLDLHPANIGARPIPNAEYEYFQSIEFSTDTRQDLSFKDLHDLYLNGQINELTPIIYIDNGRVINGYLKDLPQLKKALDVEWSFVIFDTDRSLGENNELQYQIKSGVKTHLIPYRSVLLELNWKDKPLSQSTIDQLVDSSDRDARVQDWINKKDAPILKKLSEENRQKITEQIAPLLELYSIGEGRTKVNREMTIKDLQKDFSEEISNPVRYDMIWKTIQEDIKTVKVSVEVDDDWQTLADRHGQDPETLKRLNSSTLLEPGSRITIQYDLLSNTPQAAKRRLKIAPQLFPRLTENQKTALTERQESRTAYLNSFKALQQLSGTPDEVFKFLQDFIYETSTPLSSRFRQQMDFLLRNPKLNSEQLEIIKSQLLDKCQPTYFNLMKAMYPLLADAYELYTHAYPKEPAGALIGWFHYPLETAIEQIKTKRYMNREAMRLASKFEQEIQNTQTTSVLGIW